MNIGAKFVLFIMKCTIGQLSHPTMTHVNFPGPDYQDWVTHF